MRLHCGYYESYTCRSCSLLDHSVEEIARIKYASLLNQFSKESVVQPSRVDALVSPNQVFPSRAKAKLSVSGTLQNPILGLIDAEYAGKELLNCPLHFPILNEIANFIQKRIPSASIEPYNIEARTGELKHLILTCNSRRDEVIVRFVVKSAALIPRLKGIIPELRSAFPAVRVVSANIQPLPAAILEGPEEELLTENSEIRESFSGIQLVFGPQSFVQVTPEIADRLYGFVAQQVAQKNPRVVGDIYCGVGGFSLSAARFAGQLYGMEISREAIANARRGAELNGFSNLKFEVGDAKDFLNTFQSVPFSLLIMNPPRRGIPAELVDSILERNIETLIYSSCNPETLIRDMNLLAPGYDCSSISPFDMFPLTKHLEVVAVLDRKS